MRFFEPEVKFFAITSLYVENEDIKADFETVSSTLNVCTLVMNFRREIQYWSSAV